MNEISATTVDRVYDASSPLAEQWPPVDFKEVYPKLEEIINSSDFLAIDGEFTGLHSGQNINVYDCPAKQYEKLRSGGMDFLLIQFGLCAFQYDKEKDRYQHYAYNFYVFPKQLNRSAADRHFFCDSSSLQFLRGSGFDFNKLFQHGIPYLTKTEQKRLKEQIEERQKALLNSSSAENDHIPIPPGHAPLVEKACDRIKDLISNDEMQEVELQQCNAFVRKLIYQTVSERFSEKDVYLDNRQTENGGRVLVAVRPQKENERQQLRTEKFEKELQEFEDCIGFSKVIQMISNSRKLIVGHNMLLDLCHTLHQFCDHLPYDYEEFKAVAASTFPYTLDTKFMSSSDPFKENIDSSILGHLYSTLSKEPFIMPKAEAAAEGSGYGEDARPHEAAYDAYITGLCFITMANYLGCKEKPATYPVLSSSPLLKPYLNRLHLSKSVDLMHINLTGPDPIAAREHVFHVSFPKEWKTSDLTKLFSPFGSIHISWLTDSSAFVALGRRDEARVVLKTMTQSDTYTVIPFALYERHDRACINGCADGKKIIACLKNHPSPLSTINSPSTALRKRRSLELLQNDTTGQQDASQGKGKHKRARSFGESSFSKRSIGPIPEEQEVDEASSDVNKNGSLNNEDGAVVTKKLKFDETVEEKNKSAFEVCDDWQ